MFVSIVTMFCNCVTQLKLDTGEKLSSPIFYCLSVSQSVRHRCHPTKSPLFPIYTGIQALCWPNTIYKGIKALFWVTHSILGLVCFTYVIHRCLSPAVCYRRRHNFFCADALNLLHWDWCTDADAQIANPNMCYILKELSVSSVWHAIQYPMVPTSTHLMFFMFLMMEISVWGYSMSTALRC